MRRVLAVALASGALGTLAACHRASDTVAGSDAALPSPVASAVASASASSAAPLVAPPRCRALGTGVGIPGAENLELGDAIARGDGYAVGLIHRTAAGRMAAVGLAAGELTSLRVVDLGPALGDAPPPHLAVRGESLLAVAYTLPLRGDGRELRVYDVAATGEARQLAALPEKRDDSLAFDVAPGLVVWDEAQTAVAPGSASHGVIRGATLAADGHAGAARDLSPADSDAEAPRLLAMGHGTFVLWIARRPEAVTADAAASPETVGEPRAYSWIEMATIDPSGAPVGAPRRLTPASGHVSAFDVWPLSGEARPAALVVARDQGEAVDGSGGALLRVRAREDGSDPPLAFPTDGLGGGAPTFVESSSSGPAPARLPAWLAWVDGHEALRLLPLDGAGAPAGPSSIEPSLEEKSPLLELGSRMVVAAPADSTTQLQVFSCTR